MSDQVVIPRRHLRPLYYPSGDAPDFVRYTSPVGNPAMSARDKFDLVRAEHTSQRTLTIVSNDKSLVGSQNRWQDNNLYQRFLSDYLRTNDFLEFLPTILKIVTGPQKSIFGGKSLIEIVGRNRW